ncbi:TPA: hypothetical protein SLG40_001618 [Serratia odorifera]|nr:hypothetical protein [Serratia odorifera]
MTEVLTYEAMKAERDALAVENCIQDFIITAVKDLARDSQGVIGWHLNGDVASWDEVLPELSHSETPATSAALAAIEARGVEKFAAHFQGGEKYSRVAEFAREFAAELREAK